VLSFSEPGLPNKGKAKENQKNTGRKKRNHQTMCKRNYVGKFSLHKNLISVNDKFMHLGVAYIAIKEN